jgi:signal transduction histidine kinase
LAGVASRLSNAGDDQFDAAVTQCLRDLVNFLGFDRSTIMVFSGPDSQLLVTHCWAAQGLPCPEPGTVINAKLPWFTHQIQSGHMVRVSSNVDLPSTAAQERAYILQSGLKSTIAIPMVVENAVMGAVAFSIFDVHSPQGAPGEVQTDKSSRAQGQWSWAMVSRLRLVGEVFALGIRRRQYAQGLGDIIKRAEHVRLQPTGLSRGPDEHLRQMAVHLIQSEQVERRRMGDQVHEDVMQVLAGAGMAMELAKEPDAQKRSAAITRSQQLLKEALLKLRRLAMELRPGTLGQSGIVDALRWLAKQVRRAHGLEVEVETDGMVDPLDGELRPFLYDAARKLLDNVASHSQCRQARVAIGRPDPRHVQLTVSDEGVGFAPNLCGDVPGGSFGLFCIAEEAELLGGHLEVHSAPGRGTRVVLTVPADGSTDPKKERI